MTQSIEECGRDDLLYNAKLAEQAERYDEMRDFMKAVGQLGQELSVEERNLLSVAYKNAVGARRASWRVVSSVEEKKKTKGHEEQAALAAQFRRKIEKELRDICEDILSLLSKWLIPAASSPESQVFLYKMKGDYYRYIAEFAEGEAKEPPKRDAQAAYAEATRLAEAHLPTTHPIRLGLALNYSVFFYEILDDSSAACDMAKRAFDLAIAELDAVSEESYRDSTLIMHLLRDNLTLWSPSGPEGPAPGGEPAEEPTKKEED